LVKELIKSYNCKVTVVLVFVGSYWIIDDDDDHFIHKGSFFPSFLTTIHKSGS
jgi:hypothetical protein